MNEFDEAQKLIEELFEEGSTDEMNEEELDSSEFTEEEMEALMKIQELLHIQETLHSHYIQKLLEYNKTHEVKMELESVTGEDGKTYVKYWGLLPVKNEEGEGEMRILLGTTPAEEESEEEVKVKPKREHIKKSARAEARERLEARIDPDLICPMNTLITVLKETDDFCENEFGSEDNEIHHIRKKNQYKPSEGKECNRAENLQLLPREVHKNLTYYASKLDAEHNKELEEKIKNVDSPSFQLSQEQFQDLLMAALYDCNVSGGKAIMYTTTITDKVEDIEAEAHVLDVGKILKQNLEECE